MVVKVVRLLRLSSVIIGVRREDSMCMTETKKVVERKIQTKR